MNAETFAEWLRRQGYPVVRTLSSYWYEASPRVYQSFPYHWVIQPREEELTNLLRERKAIALRYSTSIGNPSGCISYHAIYEEPSYSLDQLDRRSRQNVRTGLKNCRIEPVPLERLAKEGWSLELDTAQRQGRRLSVDQAAWEKRLRAAVDLPGFEGWGAFVEGRLVASLFGVQIDDCCELISQQCHRDFLAARVNNALTFIVTQTMVNRGDIHSVFYTLQSLDAHSTVDEFKFRMGYTAKPLRQRVVFHPWIKSFAIPFMHKILRNLLRKDPENAKLSKGEGLLRFHLEGRRSLAKQTWPECLGEHKATLLQKFSQLQASEAAET
jgi:hypothetical protein